MLKPLKRHLRYWRHEFRWWWRGDTRSEFVKLVERCRILEIRQMIDTC